MAAEMRKATLVFTWTDNTGTGTAKPDDKVVLVACFTAIKQIIYSLNAGTRADGEAILNTHLIQGTPAETYIGFLSHDEKDAANSSYTGKIIL